MGEAAGRDEGGAARRIDVARLARHAFPTIGRLRTYTPGAARDDVIAGLALTAVLVPVGMGYAEAAGLPAVTGLYATIGALVTYFLIGPSRILVFGPDSALLPLIATVVVPLAAGDSNRAVALAGALTIMAGLLMLGGAIARLGFVTDLLSRPVRIGYMNGIALTILVAQLPKLLGFSVDAHDVVSGITGLIAGIVDGKVVPLATVIGLLCLVIILGLKRLAPRFPSVLLAVVVGAVLVLVFNLSSAVSVVGDVPRGLPPVGLPAVTVDDLVLLFPTAVAIALIAFADSSVISHSFAVRRGEHVDPDHELGALGAVNLAAGLVGGFASSGSATRTPVAEQAGAQTQVTGLIGALSIGLLLVVVPGLLSPVPTTALAAVVVAAAISLADVDGLMHLWRVRRVEMGLALTAFLAVALFGALPGIGVAVGLSLLVFIRRAWRPYDAVLGRVRNYKGYHDVTRHPEGRQIPGLTLYRWDAPLFFANAQLFREHVLQVVDAADITPRWIAVASEPITDVDTTAADMLDELITDLARRGTQLHFAEMKGRVKDRLQVYGIHGRLGGDHFHPTVGSAVKAYLARYPDIDWHDWEDEPLPPEYEVLSPEPAPASAGRPAVADAPGHVDPASDPELRALGELAGAAPDETERVALLGAAEPPRPAPALTEAPEAHTPVDTAVAADVASPPARRRRSPRAAAPPPDEAGPA